MITVKICVHSLGSTPKISNHPPLIVFIQIGQGLADPAMPATIDETPSTSIEKARHDGVFPYDQSNALLNEISSVSLSEISASSPWSSLGSCATWLDIRPRTRHFRDFKTLPSP